MSWCQRPDVPMRQHNKVIMSAHCHKLVPPPLPTGFVKHTFIPHRTSSDAINVTVLRPVPFPKYAQATTQWYKLSIRAHTHIPPSPFLPAPGANFTWQLRVDGALYEGLPEADGALGSTGARHVVHCHREGLHMERLVAVLQLHHTAGVQGAGKSCLSMWVQTVRYSCHVLLHRYKL